MADPHGFASLARQTWAELPDADVAAVVDAGMLAAAREGDEQAAEPVATAIARAAARIQHQAPPFTSDAQNTTVEGVHRCPTPDPRIPSR
ncbi:hypothetical protein [Saccharopolyspora shandongensis]|uniref:hypothetical protein n=1 Tax=Saccharopolyspora shandongensis TaxID=418495 RepID=UPI0033C6118C